MKRRVFHNPVIGDKVTLIKSAEETNGECSLLEVELVPGGGNALHTRDTFTEKFHVLEGRLTVKLGTAVHQLERAVLVSMAGTIPTGLIKLLMPLFQLIANFSKKTEAELINKYC